MLLTVAAVIVALVPPAAANPDPELWAVQAPLASRSLLLDVAIADGRLIAVGERGHILISDDGGGAWRQADVPTRSTLTGVWFEGRELGWAVGHDAVIVRTRDGGATWERVHWAPQDESPLLDVWFSSPLEGLAVGAYGSCYRTADGGASWRSDPISEDDFHLHRLARAADGTLYLAAEAGIVYRSDDGGESWYELESPYEGSFFGVLPLAGDTVLLFGLRGHLFRSEDGGDSWAQLETGTTALLTDGVVLRDGTVVVVGLAGALLVSHDGGGSFTLRAQDDRRGMNAVVEGADGSLVMVGEGGVKVLPVSELVAAAGRVEGGEAP